MGPDHIDRPGEEPRDTIWPFRERRALPLVATLGTSEHLSATTARLVRGQAMPADLRASVAAYAQRLRLDGEPPQRMLVDVKAAVRDALPPGLDAADGRALVADVVRWSIHAYYHAV